jgi:DNA polymerase III alpha subunit
MEIDAYGQVQRTEQEIIDIILQNPDIDISDLFLIDKNVVEKFNVSAKKCSVDKTVSIKNEILDTLENFDKKNQKNWFIPEEYFDINIVELLLDKTSNEGEYQRVVSELELFYEKDMIHILTIAIYLVDVFRKNNIVWGVGRGSSVASYCLFLIGLHKINSLQYNLDIHEFLK